MDQNLPSHVVLPCTVDQFGNFVSSLLGQPQEIEGGRFGHFAVSREEIEQTYHLITQRVEQQNGVKPIGITIRIVYDDGTSIQLNSFSDFQSFNEPKPVVSTEAHLTLIYLIEFPLSKSPERQDITISFISSSSQKSPRLTVARFSEGPVELYARGFIGYKIKYTARTWGADIEGLLRNHIDHIIKPESKIRVFVRRKSFEIGLFVGVVVFLILFYGQSMITERAIANQLRGISDLLGGAASVNEKLDAIMKMIVSGTATKLSEMSTRYVSIGALFSLILAFYVGAKADNRKPSFVTLTKRAFDEKDYLLKKFERNWIKFWASTIFGLLIGVGSNVVYDHFAKQAISDLLKDLPAVVQGESK